ncbi:response regulator transcription factor [Kribbella karoonensis]|uniref:Response regulator transcription factor n=1 Tax=Kribbella karoonensis TaxID=324851 RepID=A0ABN2D028_9ACTN
MIKVFVADDQDLVRAGAVATVNAQPDMTVVGEAADGEQAVRGAASTRADVVLMDLRMPLLDGIEATRRIVGSERPAKILVLTTFDADEYVYAALRAGASGFVVKDAPVGEIASAVRAVHRGDSVLSPSVTHRVVEQLLAFAPDPALRQAGAELLSDRELEVVRLVATGLSNAEIGERVFLSEATVKTHVGRVLTKLSLRDRVQIAVWAHRHGLAR